MSKNRTEQPNIASGKIDVLEKDEIFVFGSNLAGQHKGGGLTGQAYAIPTMQGGVETIKPYVDEFIEFAKAHTELKFLVTRIGCGIAGFKDEEIAPLFKKAMFVYNIFLPKEFYDIIVAPYLAEENWVRFHFDDSDYLLNETLFYIKEGLADFHADDGVPISMKAILYNRFCHNRRPRAVYNPLLIGAIIGDIAGSIYEFNPHKSNDINLQNKDMEYTDDTIMTIAVADWILNDKKLTKKGLVARMQQWGRKYPNPMGAYGGMFSQWLSSNNPKPYNSWGNGAAMRVAAVGFAFSSLEETLKVAQKSAEVTHNHPEGIKGAQATAAASENFGYDMNRTCDDIRPTYSFDGSCQGTVPESIIAFLDSKDYEDALRLCISLGGDADTMGAITGAIAGAYYHQMPYDLYEFAMNKLPDDIKGIIKLFDAEHARNVSYTWRNPNYNTDDLIRKVKSGEIFI